MQKLTNFIIATALLALSDQAVIADTLIDLKNQCKEIGYKAGTEKFGECVLELNKRKKEEADTRQQQLRAAQQNIIDQAKIDKLNQLLMETKKQRDEQIIAQREAESDARRRSFSGAMMQYGLGLAQTGQPPVYNPSTGGFQSPPRTDLNCVNRCISLGFLKGLCDSQCSF